MSGRHQPLHGADSASALDIACPVCDATYTVYETHSCAPLKRYRVRIKDEEGPAWWVTVNAIGPNDAREQGRQKAYDQGAQSPGVLRVEEVPERHHDRGRMTDEPSNNAIEDKDAYYDLFGSGER